MPNLAANHPQIVHFAIAACLLGVAFRLVSITGRLTFTKHAATVLILIGAAAAWLGKRSGTDAHGPVERIPGVRTAVQEHEELGEDTATLFLIVGGIEIAALGLGAWTAGARYGKWAYVASAVVGVYASTVLYEAAEHGGALVYSYGGGPGLRTGKPEDVERLLIAGLYNKAALDRRTGNGAEAAKLFAELAARMPADTTAQFLKVESLLLDLKDAKAALAAAREVGVDEKNPRFVTRKASLMADAFVALGQPDSARAVLQPVVTAFPQNMRLKAKLDSIR